MRGIFRVRLHQNSAQRGGFTILELLVVLAIIGVLIAFFMPATRNVRPAARRAQCRNFLGQIAIALHNYEAEHHAFPPAYTVDADGKPLHSWRTLILPYMDQKPLYDRIDLSKAWDDPVNADALKTPVLEYGCPAGFYGTNQTTYLGVATPRSFFRPNEPRTFAEITDGTSRTVMVIEVDTDHAVPWMSPTDADEALILGLGPKSKLSHTGGFHAVFVDGSRKFLSTKLAAADRLALISVADNDKVSTEP